MTGNANPDHDPTPHFADSLDYVTVRIGEQLLGLPIERVRDVFIADRITVVPAPRPTSSACSTCVAGSSPRSACATGSAAP